MPVTITESDSFPATLIAPSAGEGASAPGLVSQFLQGIANRSRYLYNRWQSVRALVEGGTLTQSGSVTFTQPIITDSHDIESGRDVDAVRDVQVGRNLLCTGTASIGGAASAASLTTVGNVNCGDLNAGDGAFGGRVSASSGIQGRFATLTADGNADISIADHWFCHPDSGDINVQIVDSSFDNDIMYFTTWGSVSHTNVVNIKKPGGTTIITLQFNGGAVVSCTVVRTGSIYKVWSGPKE